MIFNCDCCKEDYKETDPDQIELGERGCEVICFVCARFIWDNAKKYFVQPERLSEKDRKVCDSPNTPTKGSETSRND